MTAIIFLIGIPAFWMTMAGVVLGILLRAVLRKSASQKTMHQDVLRYRRFFVTLACTAILQFIVSISLNYFAFAAPYPPFVKAIVTLDPIPPLDCGQVIKFQEKWIVRGPVLIDRYILINDVIGPHGSIGGVDLYAEIEKKCG